MSANLQVDGDIVVGDDLDVTSDASIGGNLDVVGGVEAGSLLVNGLTTLTGAATASAGVIVPTGQRITYQGTADEIHGTRQLVIHALGMQPLQGSSAVLDTITVAGSVYLDVWRIGVSSSVGCALPLRVGTRILDIQPTISWLGAGGSNAITVTLLSDNLTGTGGTVTKNLATLSSSVSNVLAQFGNTAINVTLATSTVYRFRVTAGDALASNGIHVHAIRITYDRPV